MRVPAHRARMLEKSALHMLLELTDSGHLRVHPDQPVISKLAAGQLPDIFFVGHRITPLSPRNRPAQHRPPGQYGTTSLQPEPARFLPRESSTMFPQSATPVRSSPS